MTITLTVTGDTVSPEITQMLQSLGVALQKDQATETPKIDHEPEPELMPRVAKRTSRKKVEKIEEPHPEPEETEIEEEKPRITLEQLREKAVIKLKEGKTDAFKAILSEFGYKGLSEAKKEDFDVLNDKIESL